jgi:hypothetical protein
MKDTLAAALAFGIAQAGPIIYYENQATVNSAPSRDVVFPVIVADAYALHPSGNTSADVQRTGLHADTGVLPVADHVTVKIFDDGAGQPGAALASEPSATRDAWAPGRIGIYELYAHRVDITPLTLTGTPTGCPSLSRRC